MAKIYKKKTSSKTFKKKSISKKSTSYLKPKSNFVKSVKKVIHGMAENKVWANYAVNQSIGTCSGAAVPYVYGLLPQISQGSSVQQRNGNSCSLMSNTFYYAINMLPYNAVTNPISVIYVKMWVVSLKNKSQIEGVPLLSDFNNFFQSGSTNLNFQGTTLDTLLKVNTDLWTVHKTIVHTLGVVASTPATSANGYGGSNNPQARGVISCAQYAKSLKYNDATVAVSNRSLYLVIQPVTVEGSSAAGYISAEIHFNHEAKFEDL